MRILRTLVGGLACAATMLTIAAPGDPVVATDRGQLQGRIEQGLATFKGIRYAAPPVGDLRWREPQPPAHWNGAQPAQAFGASCPQNPNLSIEAGIGDPRPMAEDCLFLNVWTPRANANARLPVMVWIHGGAFVLGSTNQPIYDGAPLAQRGVVVVTLNYRLGALGFFAHPALAAGRANAPVNFGLFDQIAALRWVRNNIRAFGGDPANVTLFGESAGAESVLALYASPLARGLFAKGIAQSPYGIPSHPLASAQQIAANVATSFNLNGANATAAELRAIPADALASLRGTDLSLAPSLTIGDAALPELILTAFQRGAEAKAPLIIGSNSDEGSIAAAFGIDPAKLVQRLGAARLLVDWLYPSNLSDAQLGREVVRDLVFTTFVRRIAWLHSARAPTWRYYFSYVPVGLRGRLPGVPHGGEIAFTMDTVDVCRCLGTITDTDRNVARRVSSYWISFARANVPMATGGVGWPLDGRNESKLLEFGEREQVRVNFMQERLETFIAMLNLIAALVAPQ
jgi:para-nitrobenzyl esterase